MPSVVHCWNADIMQIIPNEKEQILYLHKICELIYVQSWINGLRRKRWNHLCSHNVRC